MQLAFFIRATFRGIQNAFFRRRQGLPSEAAWADYEGIVRDNLSRPAVPVWWLAEWETYDAEFAKYVDRLLAERPAV